MDVTPVELILGNKARFKAGPRGRQPTPRTRFADLSGVRPMIESCPLERAAEAYARMMSGKAQFRVVLTM